MVELFAIATLALGRIATEAKALPPGFDRPIVDLHVVAQDVRQAFTRIASLAGVRVSFAPQIQGKVSLQIPRLPAGKIVELLCGDADIEHWWNGRVLHFWTRSGPLEAEESLLETGGESEVTKIDHPADLHKVLAAFFEKHRVPYLVGPSIGGVASADLPAGDLDSSMRRFLGSMDLTCRVEGGVYVVLRKQLCDPRGGNGSDRPPPAPKAF